jgi:hypothetical protein
MAPPSPPHRRAGALTGAGPRSGPITRRARLRLDQSAQGLLVQMSEGNPGCMTVLAALLTHGMDGLTTILQLDDMNVRGDQLHYLWRDLCGGSIARLREAVARRDGGLVERLNAYAGSRGETVVTDGASVAHLP